MKPTYGRVSRYGIVAFASSLDQIGPFARDVRDAAALLHAVAGRDDRDSTSSPEPVPATLTALPADDDEAAASLRGQAARPAARVLRGGHGARRRGARPRGRRGARGGRRDRRGGQPAAHRLRPRDLLHRRPGRGVGQPRPLRRDPLRAAARATATSSPTTWRTRGQGFGAEVKRRIMLGTYALSAGYYDAYYLKAQKVRTLIKGDFDALWAQGFDALVAPTSPTVAFRLGDRLADPVSMYLSDACTLPGQHGRPARRLDPVRPVRRAAGRPPADRRARGPRPRCSGWRAATRRSPPTRRGARSSRPPSPSAADPGGPEPRRADGRRLDAMTAPR